jgi:hypothetical protein
MSLFDRVRYCMRRDMRGFRPFQVDGARVGWLRHAFAERLCDFPGTFLVSPDSVRLEPRLDGFDARTRAVADVLEALRGESWLGVWRNEAYPVATSYYAPPLLQIERAAVPAFGVQAYGVHLNGYIGRGDDMRMWVARRSRFKPTAPGKLDHLVAGGQPIGVGLMQNLIKECEEEASLPADLARRARPVGAVSYLMENEEGLRNDILFNYDLEVPADFVPRNADGEIEEFFLWPIDRVIRVVSETEDFKFNVALVVVDFLFRHGFLDPEDREYLDVLHCLRSHPDARAVT